MGFFAASFTQGPYFSHEQERWYRYGSLAFVLAGAVLPAIGLFAARRSRWIVGASILWMAAIFGAFLWYIALSGGGV